MPDRQANSIGRQAMTEIADNDTLACGATHRCGERWGFGLESMPVTAFVIPVPVKKVTGYMLRDTRHLHAVRHSFFRCAVQHYPQFIFGLTAEPCAGVPGFLHFIVPSIPTIKTKRRKTNV